MLVNSRFVRSTQRVIDRYPTLQKPAHFAFSSVQTTRNATLFWRIKHLGYQPNSLSVSGQDRWVIDVLKGKTNGFFIDLGAGDGFSGNNTYVLEKYYGWKGLCIEPNPILFDVLTNKYERRCTRISDLVDAESKRVDYLMNGQDSGIIDSDTDNNDRVRAAQIEALRLRGRVKTVRTKTLVDVLDENSAPRTIDYFSFDVEGAETRILRNFRFDRYTFLTLTIERPTPELNDILFRNGYSFVRNSLYDTFYVHQSIPGFSEIKRMPFEQLPQKSF